MFAKRFAAALALACLLCLTGAAQAAKPSTGTPLISIENGYAAGFNMSSSDFGTSFDLSLGFGVTDQLQLYFTNLAGDGGTVFPAYRLFGASYALLPKLGLMTSLGKTGTTNVVGIGAYSLLFEREIGGLSTFFKLKLDYIMPLSDFAGGLVRIDMLAGLGLGI
jgi:hypothetical protein